MPTFASPIPPAATGARRLRPVRASALPPSRARAPLWGLAREASLSPISRRPSGAPRGARAPSCSRASAPGCGRARARRPCPSRSSFGAPRPLIRSSLPSSEPAGIFSETAPSGVGTSTLPPSAAVGNETGTCDDEVVAAALVRVRLRDARDDDQVAVRAAVLAGLALALEPDLRAVLDARLDLHGERAPPPFAARAVALRARLLDHGAVAAAARARLREREQALRLGDDARGRCTPGR